MIKFKIKLLNLNPCKSICKIIKNCRPIDLTKEKLSIQNELKEKEKIEIKVKENIEIYKKKKKNEIINKFKNLKFEEKLGEVKRLYELNEQKLIDKNNQIINSLPKWK